MTSVNPYLIFNGNCEEAFSFYKSVFGGEFPYIRKYKDMPSDENSPKLSDADTNKVMHISLPIGNTVLMGSDSNAASGEVIIGGNFSISINVENTTEADRLFNGLSAGGNPHMPMSKTFWGAYFGMFTDKFGINWMVNYDVNEKNKAI